MTYEGRDPVDLAEVRHDRMLDESQARFEEKAELAKQRLQWDQSHDDRLWDWFVDSDEFYAALMQLFRSTDVLADGEALRRVMLKEAGAYCERFAYRVLHE